MRHGSTSPSLPSTPHIISFATYPWSLLYYVLILVWGKLHKCKRIILCGLSQAILSKRDVYESSFEDLFYLSLYSWRPLDYHTITQSIGLHHVVQLDWSKNIVSNIVWVRLMMTRHDMSSIKLTLLVAAVITLEELGWMNIVNRNLDPLYLSASDTW